MPKITFQQILTHIKNGYNILSSMLFAIVKDYIQGTLPLRATSLVYTTILSFVPLLALSFSVLKSFGVHNQLAPFLQNILAPLGQKGIDVSQNILLFVDNIKVGVLGAIGLGFLLFTVVSLVQKIEAAFNDIWHVKKERPHVQRFTSYLSVITVGPIVIFSLVGLKTAFTTNPLIANTLGVAVSTGITPLIIEAISAVAMPILLFTFMNKTIPNTKVKWIPAFISGIATAYMWKAIATGFATFMSNSANYDAIYSSFAIILLIFIWLYLNWLIILIGASLCFYIQNPSQIKKTVINTKKGYQEKLYQALSLIDEMHIRFIDGKKPLTKEDAIAQIKNRIDAEETLEALSQEGICAITGETDKAEIVLLKQLKKITLGDIVNTVLGGHSFEPQNSKKEIIKTLNTIENTWKKETLDKILK